MVDASKLADTILAQRGIGSVIKQSLPEEFDGQEGVEDPNEVAKFNTYNNEHHNAEINSYVITFIQNLPD